MESTASNEADLKQHAPPLANFPALVKRAGELLRTPHALMSLSLADANCVAQHMRLVNFAKGMALIRQGDDQRADYLLLLLEGDVLVDTTADGATDAVAIAVVGPGSIIGEMALLDGGQRSASCIAMSPVQAAGLSRQGLERLIELHPQVAAKLMVELASRIADRLRALGEQLQMYARLTSDLQAEVTRLRAPTRL
jgi:CRP-like cAMP-binding protein